MTALASLLTDHRMSGLPIRVKYWLFKTICEQASDISPTDRELFLLEIDGHPSKDLRICFTALSVHSIVRRIFEHVQQCRWTTLQFSREALPNLVIFQFTQQEHVIQTFF